MPYRPPVIQGRSPLRQPMSPQTLALGHFQRQALVQALVQRLRMLSAAMSGGSDAPMPPRSSFAGPSRAFLPGVTEPSYGHPSWPPRPPRNWIGPPHPYDEPPRRIGPPPLHDERDWFGPPTVHDEVPPLPPGWTLPPRPPRDWIRFPGEPS